MKKHGFTLVELIIVIIAVLLVVFMITKVIEHNHKTKTKIQVVHLKDGRFIHREYNPRHTSNNDMWMWYYLMNSNNTYYISNNTVIPSSGVRWSETKTEQEANFKDIEAEVETDIASNETIEETVEVSVSENGDMGISEDTGDQGWASGGSIESGGDSSGSSDSGGGDSGGGGGE